MEQNTMRVNKEQRALNSEEVEDKGDVNQDESGEKNHMKTSCLVTKFKNIIYFTYCRIYTTSLQESSNVVKIKGRGKKESEYKVKN